MRAPLAKALQHPWVIGSAIALLYYATAKGGQYLAIPPGFITPVYAPSGLAVAAVLLLGPGIWPALGLSALVAAAWPLWVNTGAPSMATAAGLGIAIGSVLQALVGAWLIKTHIGVSLGAISARGRQGVGVIQDRGSHLLTLINDVLDLAKIEARKMELFPQDFPLPEFLQGLVELFAVRAEQQGITFAYEPSSTLPAWVLGDEKRLRQVLINLLGNAVKFTPTGRVMLRVQATATAAGHSLRCEVEDTGIGIAPEQLETIFLPFEQGESGTMKAEGTGLGLVISRQIVVETHGGRLRWDPQCREGVAFDIILPLVEAGPSPGSGLGSGMGSALGMIPRAESVLGSFLA